MLYIIYLLASFNQGGNCVFLTLIFLPGSRNLTSRYYRRVSVSEPTSTHDNREESSQSARKELDEPESSTQELAAREPTRSYWKANL